MHFVVGAKTLDITESPQTSLKEGTKAIFKCCSDEGNPPPVICWNRGTGTNIVKSGRYHANKTESTLGITVDRTMNQEEIGCYIEEDETNGQSRLDQRATLLVKCE